MSEFPLEDVVFYLLFASLQKVLLLVVYEGNVSVILNLLPLVHAATAVAPEINDSVYKHKFLS